MSPLAHHTLRKTMGYYGGVNALVHQSFFQLDRSRHVPVRLKPFTTHQHTDELASLMDSSARHASILITLSSTYHSGKEGEGIRSYARQSETHEETLVASYESNGMRDGFVVFCVPVWKPINIKNYLGFTTSCF